jgi:hypothetical protein
VLRRFVFDLVAYAPRMVVRAAIVTERLTLPTDIC